MNDTSKKQITIRLRYWLHRLRAVFTLDGFVIAPIWVQQIIVLLIAAVIVLLFTPFIGSYHDSYKVFMQTTGLEELTDRTLLFGFIEFVLGIMVMSFIISLLSSALDQFVGKIKEGTLSFKRSNHFVIINTNDMLIDILFQMNDRAASARTFYDIVILVGDSECVLKTRQQLVGKNLLNLAIYVRQGDAYNVESYRNINLCGANGTLLLQDDGQSESFFGDDNILKILFVLTGWRDFKATLQHRMEEKDPFKFVVEINNSTASRDIVTSLTNASQNPLFSVVYPLDIIDRLLSRAIVDLAYYHIFDQLFSFYSHEIYFMEQKKVMAGLDIELSGQRFKEANLGFQRGILIGLSRFQQGEFKTLVCPMEEIIQADDWLIFVAEDENSIVFDATIKLTPQPESPPQPSEFVSRRICMLGTEHSFPSLASFLDPVSRQIYYDNLIVLPDPEQYFQKELVMQLKNGNFDTVVINLQEHWGFRLTAYIMSMFPPEEPFLQKLMTIMISTVTDEILNAGKDNCNTVLSQKLSAKYLTQVLFQKTLDQVIKEISSPEGYELNLLTIGIDFPRESMKNKTHIKQLLLASNMVYAGIIDADKKVLFDCEDFSTAIKIIVLAKGDM